MKWRYTKTAVNDLLALDKKIAQRIAKKIRYYCERENPLSFAARLTGPLGGLFRFRIGDYRVIFRKDGSGNLIVLLILRIKHRKDVYEK